MLQLILDPGADLHQRMPMLQQLPHVSLYHGRHPYHRKSLLQQHLQNVPCRPWVTLLPPRIGCRYGRRISDQQLVPQLLQQPLEPQRVATAFQTHHYLSLQSFIKSLRFAVGMQQRPLAYFPSFAIHHRYLLKARMKITTYNLHKAAPWTPSSLAIKQPQCTRVQGAVVVIQSRVYLRASEGKSEGPCGSVINSTGFDIS